MYFNARLKKNLFLSIVVCFLLLLASCGEEVVIPTYNVSFTVDGIVINTITVDEGSKVSFPADPVKDEHTFIGWYDVDENKVEDGLTITKDMEIVAKFEIIKYTLTIDYNDGSGKIDTYNYAAGTILKKPTMPSKTGYSFAGWYIGEESFDFDRMPNKNITVTAKWKLNETIITFRSNGGTGVSQIIALPGDKITAPKDPYRKLCKFLGWYTEDGELFVFDTMPSENIVLYAKWEGQTYTINYNLNGGSCDNLIVTYSSDRDNDIELPRPKKDGYAFLGWYTREDFASNPIFVINDDINKNLTLHARWTEVKTKELKTIGIYGDSISTYEGYVPEDALFYYPISSTTVRKTDLTWWRLLQEKIGAELITNASYSTSPVCGTSTMCGVNPVRINKLLSINGEAPDLIIIMMGANDVVNGFKPEKFDEEYRLMLDRMKEVCPNSEFIICNILYNTCTEGQNPDKRYEAFTHPGLRAELNKVIEKIALDYNSLLVDISSLIDESTDRPNNWYYLGDNMHPSDKGMELIAEEIAKKILGKY